MRYFGQIFQNFLEGPLGSCLIFLTNFSKSLEGEGSIYSTFLTNLSEFSFPCFEGWLQNMLAENDENFEKMETDLGGRYYIVGHFPTPS